MRFVSYFFLLVIILFGITFSILNANSVTINYYLGERNMPLSLLLAIAFSVGCLVGIIVGFCLLVKIKMKNYRLRQRLTLAEKEIENLRAIPLQDKV